MAFTACASVPEGDLQLQAHDWELVAAHDRAGAVQAQGHPIGHERLRLQFAGQHIVVLHLCNRVSARYEHTGRQLRVALPMATKRACADSGLMAWEQQVLRQMPQWQSYEWWAPSAGQEQGMPRLVLHSADGSRWEWRAVPKGSADSVGVPEQRAP